MPKIAMIGAGSIVFCKNAADGNFRCKGNSDFKSCSHDLIVKRGGFGPFIRKGTVRITLRTGGKEKSATQSLWQITKLSTFKLSEYQHAVEPAKPQRV
jgi:hypothetical protein